MALVQITENTLRAFLADAEIAAFDSAGAEGDYPERAGRPDQDDVQPRRRNR